MKRKGKKLQVLPDGHPRRMSDGKNAFRKMSEEQRIEFFRWIGPEQTGRFVTLAFWGKD